jgi:hypothetical protein
MAGGLAQPSQKRHAGQGHGEKLSQQGRYALAREPNSCMVEGMEYPSPDDPDRFEERLRALSLERRCYFLWR